MVVITVNFTPPLSGIAGTLYLVTGEVYNRIMDVPLSQNGVMDADIITAYPDLSYAIVFPEQTIGGVNYLRSQTPLFNLTSPKTFNITLETIPVNGNGPTPPFEVKSIAVPGIAGILLMFLILRG